MTYCKENDSFIEKLLRKVIALVVVLALAIPVISPEVFAASSVVISGGDNVKGGDTFTVVVTFSGGNIGRVDAQLTYDTDKLTYLSGGSSTGNSGYVQLKMGGTDGSVTFNLEFQAISEGSTSLEVKTWEMYDTDESYMGETPSASKTITISGSAAQDQIIEQTSSPDQPVEETEMIGVDEKEDEESDASDINMILLAIAVVLLVLIIITAVALSKKKKHNAAGSSAASYQDSGADGESCEKEDIGEEKRTARKRASEETERWEDWKGIDDDDRL